MIDLLLINPRSRHGGTIPLGLLSLASYVRENGFSVQIVDENTQNLKRKLHKCGGARVIGVTATTDRVISAYRICEEIKKCFKKEAIVVLGGIHATALPEISLKESLFDIAVVSEGERTITELLSKVTQGNKFPTDVPGTVVKFDGEIIVNKPRELIKDLDELPLPAYDLINIQNYFLNVREHIEFKRPIPVMIGRGCPFDCVFCSSKIMWRRRARFFSADYVVKHVKFLIDKYGIDAIPFQDEEFLLNREFSHELLDAFLSSGMEKKIKWSCEARVDSIDGDLIRKMKKAGCALVRFGMESGAQETLGFLKKRTVTVEDNINAALMCKEENLECFGSFIIGSPMETIDTLIETIDFIQKYMVGHKVAVFVAVPYPGTELYHICKQKGFLRNNVTWNDFIVENGNPPAIIRSENFTAKQLSSIRNYINLHVVEPINLGKKPARINHYEEIKKILRGDLRLASNTGRRLYYASHRIFRNFPSYVREGQVIKVLRKEIAARVKSR